MNQILIAPIITEKALTGITDGVYTFKVSPKANKVQITQELKGIYKVDAQKINIINLKPERVLIKGRFTGKKKGWKKAIVTLKKGQKIPDFEAK